jgi:triacylglycerol lipase
MQVERSFLMKKSIFMVLIAVFMFSLTISGCSSSSTSDDPQPTIANKESVKEEINTEPQPGKGLCATRYPIVMVHGLGWKDYKNYIQYYNGIPAALNEEGAKAFPANQVSFGGQKKSAESLAMKVSEILAATKSKKVNLIGQSQGGPIIRYYLANCEVPVWFSDTPLKASEVTASATTVGSPHKGTEVCDALAGLLDPKTKLGETGLKALEKVASFLWNDDPQAYEAFYETSVDYMEFSFNKEIPIVGPENGGYYDGVYYQSYAGKLDRSKITLFNYPLPNAIVFVPTGIMLDMLEGNSLDYDGNDGFVSVHSAKMGNFRGIIPVEEGYPGADHAFQLNHFFGWTPGFDAKKFYVELAADLKEMGF